MMRCRQGFTLIETILAVVIAAVVIALGLSIYHTTSETVRGQQERRRGGHAGARALEQLARDLVNSLPVEEHRLGRFALQAADERGATRTRLSFCTAIPRADTNDLRWFEIHHVTYRQDGTDLVRTHQPLVGPGAMDPPVTNRLARDVHVFSVRVHNGEEWADRLETEEVATWPRAARVELQLTERARGRTNFSRDIFIPVGSEIQREP